MRGRFRTRRGVVGLAVAAAVTIGSPLALAPPLAHAASSASPASILTWDSNAEYAIWDVARTAPQNTGRFFAMVHDAMYDAVNAIYGAPYQPYLVAPAAKGSESVDAAVATSAYQVLVSAFPAQQADLQAKYGQSLAAIPDGAAKKGGIAIGAKAAAAMVAARQNDGAFGPQTFPVGTEPGQWRPTPPAFANDGGWVGHVKPFMLASGSMFRTAGPPALTSSAYASEINEVKAIGAVDSTVRTTDQTQAAIWWHDRRLGEWEIKRQLVTTQHLTALQAARMFAMADTAEADADIACFSEKEAWLRWRPITAIREADTDGNAATVADPNWTPLLVTPPHPDYTSGHACATAAVMLTLTYFFKKDSIAFSAYSADSGTRRYFSSFSQAIAEVDEARIWGGIHTRSADTQGAKIGAQVVSYMIPRYFRSR
jgi:hypothetical protein